MEQRNLAILQGSIAVLVALFELLEKKKVVTKGDIRDSVSEALVREKEIGPSSQVVPAYVLRAIEDWLEPLAN